MSERVKDSEKKSKVEEEGGNKSVQMLG